MNLLNPKPFLSSKSRPSPPPSIIICFVFYTKKTWKRIPEDIPKLIEIQCSPANPAQAGEEAVGLADFSGLPSSFCVLVGQLV